MPSRRASVKRLSKWEKLFNLKKKWCGQFSLEESFFEWRLLTVQSLNFKPSTPIGIEMRRICWIHCSIVSIHPKATRDSVLVMLVLCAMESDLIVFNSRHWCGNRTSSKSISRLFNSKLISSSTKREAIRLNGKSFYNINSVDYTLSGFTVRTNLWCLYDRTISRFFEGDLAWMQPEESV